MTGPRPCRVALLYPGNREARKSATPASSRFLPIFDALAALGRTRNPRFITTISATRFAASSWRWMACWYG